MLVVIAFVAGCLAVDTINGIDSGWREFINDHHHSPSTRFGVPVDLPDTPDIVDGSRAACGWIIFLCVVAVIYQSMLTLLRFLNIGLVNMKITYFLITVRQMYARWCVSTESSHK